jgi:photosystem II stability/assembly factor-like uncharacterized protein
MALLVCAFLGVSLAATLAAAPAHAEFAWQPMPESGDSTLTNVAFLNETEGLATALLPAGRESILRTWDGGASWDPVYGPDEQLWLGPLFFLDSDTGWAVAEESSDTPGGFPFNYYVLRTDDGGSAWTKSVVALDAGLLFITDIVFVDRSTGFIFGSGRKGVGTIIFRTTDGGATWAQYEAGEAEWSMDGVSAASFADGQNGWAVAGWETDMGEGSSILHTSDGGLSWERQFGYEASTPTGDHPWYRDVDFVDSQHGWVVGDGGLLLSTTDGGETWGEPESSTTVDLTAVDFVSPTEGWVAGVGGLILHTTDAGVSWETENEGSPADVLQLRVFNDYQGFALTSEGTLLALGEARAFADTRDSRHWQAIEALARAGIVTGYPDGTFRPGDPVKRAQMAKMLVETLGLPVSEGALPCPFQDVERPTDNLYPDDYVAAAAANGIVKGFDSRTFGPYETVTRAQVVSMVVRAAERLRPDRLETPPVSWDPLVPFGADSQWGPYAGWDDASHGGAIRTAWYNGLLSIWNRDGGSDPSANEWFWDPWAPATRGEVARVLYLAFGGELPPLSEYRRSDQTLEQAVAILERSLGPGDHAELPTDLPSGWGYVQPPIPSWGGIVYEENPVFEILNPGSWYVEYTDGENLLVFDPNYEGDAGSSFTGFRDSGVALGGDPVQIGYYAGEVCVSGPDWMIHGDAWLWRQALALASGVREVR